MDILKLSKFGTRFQFPSKTAVFAEGDRCENFLVLTKGTVRVFKVSESGKEFALYRVSPESPCILTTTALLGNALYPANGESETDIEGFSLSRSAFQRLTDEEPEFRDYVFGSLSNRINDLIGTIDSVVFYSLKDRLLARLRKTQNDDGWVAATHRELAADLGTDREVVSRLLKKLENEGLVETSVSKIRIFERGD